MDITLQNKEAQAIDRTYRRFDFPVPATVFTAEDGEIDFGGGKTADYVLGAQTGPKHRWMHIRNLSWNLAKDEKITGTTSAAASPTIPQFTALTGTGSGIDKIGGPSSSGAKPVFNVHFTDSTPTLNITLEYWEQTNTSDFMHEWIARGRDVNSTILCEFSFMFWPELDQVEIGIIGMRSDLTKNKGRLDSVDYIDVTMPTGWKGYYWWDEYWNRGMSTTSTVKLWTNLQQNKRWVEGASMPASIITMIPDSANAAEIADVQNKAKIGFAGVGIASRADWSGKFGPFAGFVETFTPKVSTPYRYNIPDTDTFISTRWQTYLNLLAAQAARNNTSNQLTLPYLGSPPPDSQTGDNPGIGKSKAFAPFPDANGDPGYISFCTFWTMPAFRRPVWYRHPGPGDGGAPTKNGEPIEFGDPEYDYSGRPGDPKSSYMLTTSGRLNAAFIKNEPWVSNFPFKVAEVYKLGDVEPSALGNWNGKRESHWLLHEIANSYMLTGRRIFRTFAEQMLRVFLFDMPIGDYAPTQSAQTGYNGGQISGRSGRAWNSTCWFLHCTTDMTLSAQVKTRMSDRFTKTPSPGYVSEYAELWRRVTNSFPFLINEATIESRGNGTNPKGVYDQAWTAWYPALHLPGIYAAYLETSDATILEAITHMGRTWLDDGFYYGKLNNDPTDRWYRVKYIEVPGYPGNDGTDGDRPYRNHPTLGNYFTQAFTNNQRTNRTEYDAGTSSVWWLASLKILEKVFTDASDAGYAGKAKLLHDYFFALGYDPLAERGYFSKLEDHQVNVGISGPNPEPVRFSTGSAKMDMQGGDSKLIVLGKNQNQPSSLISIRVRRNSRGVRRPR